MEPGTWGHPGDLEKVTSARSVLKMNIFYIGQKCGLSRFSRLGIFSPTGGKIENWGPKNTKSLRKMCIPSAPEILEIHELLTCFALVLWASDQD